MKTYTFRTNIQCENCLSKVKPFLDNEDEIIHWQIDLTSKDRLVTVNTATLSADDIIKLLRKVGFIAEVVA